MNVIVEVQNGVANLKVEGRLDTITAPDLAIIINDVKEKDLVLDLKKLEYISSAGLRVLLGAHKCFSKTGSMKIINVIDSVMDVFVITGFVDILNIEKDYI